MHHELTLLEREAAHNLINLRIIPRTRLSLGQTETFQHSSAMISTELTGNFFTSAMHALTFGYTIAGAGFKVVLLAIYADAKSSSAFIQVQSVSPDPADPADADGAFLQWLRSLTNEERTPITSIFDELLLD